ncbi:MAG: dockerin type I domain-containing protein, partial [Ignavibacteria bacterium]
MTIAPDGSGNKYIWGGAAGTVLYKMDSLLNRVASYTHTGAVYRTIAWDPNRKGFWSSDFAGNLVCRDTNGVVVGTVVNSLTSKYGVAFDSASTPGQAYLWVWEQSGVVGGTINKLHKFSIASNSLLNSYTFNLTGPDIGIAGAAEVEVIDTNVYLYLNWQNVAITAYDIKHPVGLLTNDVGTASINNPPATITYPNAYTPQATITNFGSATQTFNVTMKISPGGYSSTKPVTSLGSMASVPVNFDSYTPSAPGSYTITCYTQLAGDQKTSNDTLSRSLTVNPPTSSVVVPNAYENIPGTATFLGPLANSARTYQFLIQASQLTALVGKNLTGFKMRIPTSSTANWPVTDVTFSNYDVYLSGSVEPAARSLTFASNIVGPQTQVRTGSLFIPANSYTFGTSPNAFGPEISFNTPWPYAGGNVLIELRHNGFTGTSRSTDAISTSTGGYGTLISACWTGSYTGTSGSQGNFTVIELTAPLTHELKLTALIEGLYTPPNMISDTATVLLRNSTSPYAVVDASVSVLDSSGKGSFRFGSISNGVPYYIVVDHRNSITTWSATAISFSGDSLSYNFTTAASQAFGNNQTLKGTKYTIYSGDVNKDGIVDGSDAALVDNDVYNFATGYRVTDVNGDLIIDGSDASIVDNNATNFVGVITP